MNTVEDAELKMQFEELMFALGDEQLSTHGELLGYAELFMSNN